VRTALILLVTVTLWMSAGLSAPPLARADADQTTIMVDDPLVLANPTATLSTMRALGVRTLRLDVPWAAVAPAARTWKRPAFNAIDPGAYGAAWGPYDAAIIAAHALGITVDLDLAPGAPRWATGRAQPRDVPGYPHPQWEPNPAQFGQFAQAAGERYSGDWNPLTDRRDPGDPADLPRVAFWSIWNEPNYGPSLAPQALPGHPGVEDSPRIYRQLVDRAWTGLAASGHTVPTDTIIIGELAPRSELTEPGRFSTFNGMTPLVFLQNLYCLSPTYRPLRGVGAALRGCPATAGGTRRFVADNPALFQNSGVADHPYSEWFAPDQELDIPKLAGWALENTQDTSLATIGVLERGLDRLTAAYGVHEQLAIWDTEYGYQTSPPHRITAADSRPWPSPTLAADYDNWAEYLHYENPRIKSFAQYLLQDAQPALKSDDYGGFASGLISYAGVPKADYAAFRMPLYLPRTTAGSASDRLQVWGAARPAAALIGSSPAKLSVTLQFRPTGSARWSNFIVLALNPAGYYDAHLRFPTSGTLRATWSGSENLLTLAGQALYSRNVAVTVG
jgi:hypothetical protein